MKKATYFVILLILILFVAKYLNYFRSQKPTVKIGFLVTLTSKSPELGREIRDDVFLDVEELSQSGGIRSREIELIVKDIKADPKIAESSILELIKDDINQR